MNLEPLILNHHTHSNHQQHLKSLQLNSLTCTTTLKYTLLIPLYTYNMEKAKQAVSSFLSGDGKHRTSVDEDIRRAVTQETVRPHQHEEITTAIDREVHQEHHHTTVQPILQKETL